MSAHSTLGNERPFNRSANQQIDKSTNQSTNRQIDKSINKSTNQKIKKWHMSDVVVSKNIYFAIFAALVVLTGLTTVVAFFNLGVFNPVVAMSIAVVKASLVVLYFMHMRYSSRLTMIIGAASLFWLGILLVLIMSDYAVRGAGWY